jgi:hypothetical protein
MLKDMMKVDWEMCRTYFSSLSVSVMRLEERGELSRDTLI